MASKGMARLHNPRNALRYAQYTSLLPVLYQPRRLQGLRETQRQSLGLHGHPQSCSAFSTSPYLRAVSDDDIPFEDSGSHGSAGPVRGRPPSSRVRHVPRESPQFPLPRAREATPPTTQDLREKLFPSSFPDIFQESSPGPRQPRESTITAGEHEVFSRIFADLGAKDAPKAALEDDSLNDELEANRDPDEYLDRIFEAAIEMPRSSPTAEAEDKSDKDKHWIHPKSVLTFVDNFDVHSGNNDVISRTSLPLREEATRLNKARMNQAGYEYRATGVRTGSDDEPTDTIERLNDGQTEYKRKLQRARVVDRRKVESMLARAGTDVEIWRVLQDEVFSTVVRFQERLKAEEEENGRVSKKAAKKKGRSGIASDIDSKVTDPKAPPATRRMSEQVPLLAILETNYAAHCLYAIRLLRKYFRNSPYAMSLLPKIKSLGPISYVLGTSTDLYNELMFIKWREYSDLYGISVLGTEMRNRGLPVNQMTLEVLRAVLLMSKQGAKGKYGEVVMEWWRLQGSVAGLAKVSGLYGRLWSDYMEKRTQAGPGSAGWCVPDKGGRVEEGPHATV
ncbi:hypothetical protein LPUS_06800 [Lasallia pustulata]|uniref:Mtf2-like C-terminal domain-containing protein n=1 Tax=Lasallia pustulata TaxID=136370 RepID=A0A1W5D1S2_9LECA|nr:hypothetical protein LPUS_06800 [Lasallia pustulata]